jgi:DNA-binding transcriptional MerR regulator
MDSKRGFTVSQALQVAGLTRPTLHYWDRTGFLRPSLGRAYSFQDLVALRVARQLRHAGISLQALRRLVALLRTKKGLVSPLAETYLVTDGHDVYEKQGDAGLSSVLRNPGQGCLFYVLDLGRTVAEVEQAVAGLVPS